MFNKDKDSQGEENKSRKLKEAESLERSDAFVKEYEGFIRSEKFRKMLNLIRDAYELKKHNKGSAINVSLTSSPYTKGFYLTYFNELTPTEFQFMMDYFRDRLKENDYHVYMSDRREEELGGQIRQFERHYMKPNTYKSFDYPIEQYFGNVNIELVYVENEPSYLQVISNIYSDSKFSEAESFDKLMELLLS